MPLGAHTPSSVLVVCALWPPLTAAAAFAAAGVVAGLPRLNELWPSSCLDVHAFAASDPAELALALRALSDKGPPKRF